MQSSENTGPARNWDYGSAMDFSAKNNSSFGSSTDVSHTLYKLNCLRNLRRTGSSLTRPTRRSNSKSNS